MKLFKKIKEERGSITITVVAAMLFITSMIVISYFTISNKSSDQAKKIQQITKQYNVNDSEVKQKYNEVLNNVDNVNLLPIRTVQQLGNLMLSRQNNTMVTDDEGESLILPAGYKITDDSTKIANGVVIQDKNDNQWVWIPVSGTDLDAMYTEDETGWTLSGTGGETGIDAVVTKYKTTGTQARGNPGSRDYREPDVLNHTNYDNNSNNWTSAGFKSYSDMAIKLRDDYKNMIDSIRKYEGFYIGRFELGGTTEAPKEKLGKVMNNTNWYDLYKACKFFGDDNITYSRMIWGCQWDQVCKFISTYKEGNETKTRDLTNSCSYGNYKDSTGNAAINHGSSNFNSTTGRNEAWKTNNIYDLAGNCWEFTQEAYDGIYAYRPIRGGCHNVGSGASFSVNYRGNTTPTNNGVDGNLSSRPVLYIK